MTIQSLLQQSAFWLALVVVPALAGADKPSTQPVPTTRPAVKTTRASSVQKDPGETLRKRVVEVKLKNGMTFLLVQRRNVPTFSANIRVKVGGVDEHNGYTGIAHIFEHMAFKGSTLVGTHNWKKEKALLARISQYGEALSRALVESGGKKTRAIKGLAARLKLLQRMHRRFVKKDEFTRLYSANGGVKLNATTGKDLTSYFLSLPANRLELWALQESARLVAPVFREFYRERAVVVEERRMAMSRGGGRLYEQFMATAFAAHPYRFPTVGWMSDITTIPLTAIRSFFKKYYVPSNMVGAIVGDIDIAKTKALLERTFGLIPAGPKPPSVRTREPQQQGERRVNVRYHTRPMVMMGYHKPTAPHRDDDVFDVIESLLTSGRSSRLYKALVKSRMAQGVWASSLPGARFSNVFTLAASPIAPYTTKQIETVVEKELNKLKTTLVSKQELDKVRKNLSMSFLRGLRSNQGLANQLSYYQAVLGNWRYATTLNKRMNRITPEDIRRVARKYFLRHRRTVATLVQVKKAIKGKAKRRLSRRHRMLQQRAALKMTPEMKALLQKYGKAVSYTIRPLPKALAQHPATLKYPKLSFTPPKPTIVKLKNGLTLYLLEDHELPLVDVYTMIQTGRIYDPLKQIGLGALVGSVLRSGGYKGLSGDALDQELARKAATLESSISSETGMVYLSTYKDDLDWGLNKMAKLLRQPAFPENKIKLKKAQMLEAWRRRNDNPIRLAVRKFRPLIYGVNNRWSLFTNPSTLRAISRKDLVAFHKQYFHPNLMRMAIVGSFHTPALLKKIKAMFGGWKSVKVTFPKVAAMPSKVKPSIAVLPRRIPQSIILVGHLGPRRHSKGVLAGKVMNYILGGGGFSSRLMTEIRSNRGLAYFAGSQLSTGRDRGLFLAYTGTRPQSTGRTLKVLLQQLKKMHTNPSITKKELELARNTMLNRYVFHFSSPAVIVYRKMKNDYLGFPQNYMDTYRKKLQKLTLKDVELAAKAFLDPKQFVTLVVGFEPMFDQSIEQLAKQLKLGKVKRLQLK